MFRQRPRLLVDFVFPTIGSSEAPMREASAKHVDEMYRIDWGPLYGRHKPNQWQRHANNNMVLQQKDRPVNLKPDLVLVKADAFKGKRKIKDRWEEDTWEVVHQIMTDIPSYKVMNQHGKSCILHWNWLLLIASEVVIPLCIGTCHAQDRCTSPNPCKTTSVRRWNKVDATRE